MWLVYSPWHNIPQLKLRNIWMTFHNFQIPCISLLLTLSLDDISYSKLAVFLELCSWKTVCFSRISLDIYYLFAPKGGCDVYLFPCCALCYTHYSGYKQTPSATVVYRTNERVSNDFYLSTRKIASYYLWDPHSLKISNNLLYGVHTDIFWSRTETMS